MDGWVCSNGGMVVTGETEVLGEKHYTAWVVDGWIGMEQWWNGTDRVNWSAGRKTLYRVGGRWMDEYGAMVEWYWQGKLKCWEKKCPSAILFTTNVTVPLLSGSTAKYIKSSSANTVCVLLQFFHIPVDTSPKSHYSCVPPAYQDFGGIFTKFRLSLWQSNKTATICLVILFESQQLFTVEIKLRPTVANI